MSAATSASTPTSRPHREYDRNVQKILTGRLYRPRKPEGFRPIHMELAEAVRSGRKVTLVLIENCEPETFNAREMAVIRERGTLNVTGRQRGRKDSDETYVLDLCDAILRWPSERQKRFDFLLGDPGATGRQVRLPVDAYYPDLKLAIEYREIQHTEAITHFDKPWKVTVSGVHRGEQRRIYDERRRQVLPENGIKLVEISCADLPHDGRMRPKRDSTHDIPIIQALLKDVGAV